MTVLQRFLASDCNTVEIEPQRASHRISCNELQSTDRIQTQFLNSSNFRLAEVQFVNITCELSARLATASTSQLGGQRYAACGIASKDCPHVSSQYTPISKEKLYG
jgi:hypothetical protein